MFDKLQKALGYKAKRDRLEYVRSTIKPEATYATGRQREQQAAMLSLLSGYVYSAVMMNARSIAAQPIRLYASLEERGSKRWPSKSVSKSTTRYLKGDSSQRPAKSAMLGSNTGGELVEIFDHPILDLLNRVSPFMDGYNFSVLRKTFLQVTGNEYLHPIIGPLGYPVELWVMPSQHVKIIPTRDERLIEGYEYGVPPNQAKFQPDEVLHNLVPSPVDPLYGSGWVAAAAPAAGLLQSMDAYEKHLFENQARPDWGIFIKEHLNETQWNRMISYLDANLRGNRNSGRPYIFEGGSDAKPLQFSPRDLSFSEGEERKVETIAAVSGVPVSLLKANDPNLASAQVGFASYMRDTIHPYLVADAEFLNQQLLPLFGTLGEGLFLAYDNPVQEDEERISRVLISEVSSGVRSINEARSELGLEPNEDGDELRVNGIPLDVIGQPPAVPAFGALSVPGQQAEKSVATPGEKAERSEVRVGSFVEWRTEKGKYLGKIRRFKDSGSEPGTIGEGEATETDPIVFVQVYVRNEDESFTPSDREAPVKLSKLTASKEPENVKEKAVSESARESLQKKADDHNEEVGEAKSKRTSVRTLVAVYERGIGAYQSQPGSVRPQVSSAEQWAMARVNGFLHALKTGKFKRKPFDTDLLPESHPLSSKAAGEKRALENFEDVFTTAEEARERANELGCDGIHDHPGDPYGYDGTVYMPCSSHDSYNELIQDQQKKYEEINFTPPKDVQEEAQRGLDWRKEHGRGGTEVGVARARDLSNGVSVSPETIRRMASYFARHEVDKQGEGFSPGEDGYPSAGRIAWALWGGDAGKRWSSSIRDRMDAEDEKGEKVTRRDDESLKECVARGIDKMLSEGYDRDQAVAMAYSQCELKSVKTAFMTGMEPEMKQKALSSSEGEVWPERSYDARKAIEDVEDYKPVDADEDVREGEASNPAQRIQKNLVKVFRSQANQVVRALRGEKSFGPADLLNLLSSLSGAEADYFSAIIGPMASATSSGGKFGLNEVGSSISFDETNPRVAEFAKSYAQSFAKEASRASLLRVRSVISRGLEQGIGAQAIAKELEKDYAFSPERATVVARTESARGFVEGERLGWRESGVVRGKQWLLAPGACPFCAATAAKSTKVYNLDEPFWANGDTIAAGGKSFTVKYGDVLGAPLHPNCRCDMVPVLIEE
jgi:HK97 family phage portal protein